MPVESSIPARVNIDAKVEQYDSSEDCKPSAILAFVGNYYTAGCGVKLIISLHTSKFLLSH
jgi:hypothetical protein